MESVNKELDLIFQQFYEWALNNCKTNELRLQVQHKLETLTKEERIKYVLQFTSFEDARDYNIKDCLSKLGYEDEVLASRDFEASSYYTDLYNQLNSLYEKFLSLREKLNKIVSDSLESIE